MISLIVLDRGMACAALSLERLTVGKAIDRAYEEDSHFIFLIGKQEQAKGTVELILLHSTGTPESMSPAPTPAPLS
jgi:threonyl-tRNA synthetase